MARQPRVEYAGALHHVMSRGNGGIPIFRDDEDRRLVLDLLAQEIVRSCRVLHEYRLMTTHVHLEIETPECTLSTGMHRLLARYAQVPTSVSSRIAAKRALTLTARTGA